MVALSTGWYLLLVLLTVGSPWLVCSVGIAAFIVGRSRLQVVQCGGDVVTEVQVRGPIVESDFKLPHGDLV